MTVGAKVGGTLRARGLRRGPPEDKTAILEEQDEAEEGSGCSSWPVALATLPDKDEPLGAADGAPPAESKSRKRRRKLRKYGKNMGKVLQKGCRYVVLGLQGLANAYSSPFNMAVSVATLFR